MMIQITSRWLTLLCVQLAIFASMTFAAEPGNVVKQVQVRKDGERMLIKVEMRDPVKSAPSHWSIVEPPRIVFDFVNAQNGAGSNVQEVKTGDLKSLNIVQTDSLTRLVLNLYRTARYTSEVDGNNVFIRLESVASQTAAVPTPSAFQAKPVAPITKMDPHPSSTVRDVVFRRGEDGQAVVLIELTDGTVPVDVRRTGVGLTVDLGDVEVPERLQNRRDVNDFATPVTSFVTKAQATGARLDINARGRWFHQAQLTNNQLAIEIKPIPADEANKLVQTGQQGQKVSINFFDADATMILRTLAEISGKNVMIDPSLAGRKVTVSLDNIAYDQALDIVMDQAKAAMRIRNEVVTFGDRAILQQRDQEAADERARANDTAPLVSETFSLSYIKPSELALLVQANIAQSGGGQSQQPTMGTNSAAANNPGKPASGGGMLSSRGSMSNHDLTKKFFVRDTSAVIEAIREVIRNVDVPQKQVLIEARIVEASTGFSNSLGARMRAFNAPTTGGYPVAGTGVRWAPSTSPASLGNVDVFGAPTGPSFSSGATVFQPGYALAGVANFGLMLFNSAGSKLVSLELQAAETDQKNRTVSSPRIVTMDRKQATITNSQSVTILTGVNAQTGLPIYQTFAAPLTLNVTPSINPDNRIALDLDIQKGTITNGSTGSLDTNVIKTSVIVENGGTVVIGGFSRESENQVQDRVPFLGDIPYVGFLFKTTTKIQNKSELLVFITPKIVNEVLAAR